MLEDTYCAEALLKQLAEIQPELFGGDAYPMLTSVGAEGTSIKLVFSYFFDNVIIMNDDDTVSTITLTLQSGRLIRADISLMNANDISYRVKNYPMFTVLRVLTPGASPEHGSLLRLAYKRAQGDCYTEWILETY